MTTDAHDARGFKKVADLVGIAGSMRPMSAVLAGGERVEDLRLVESARDHGIIERVVLVGREHRIAESVAQVGIHVDKQDIHAADDDETTAALTVELVKAGAVQMVLKGTTPTHVLHRHMLPLALRTTVSLVSLFDAAPIGGGRPMIVTDAGVTTVCNYARIAGLIQNAVDVARAVMRIAAPRVALLSANEKQLLSLPSTLLGAAFTRRGWPDAHIYGPLSLDLATDPGAVASKGLPDEPEAREVAGRADILVCPGIDAANVLYKMVSALIKHGDASLANIIMGFPMPYVLLSRSDALETRLNSVALGAIYAQQGLGARTRHIGTHDRADTTTYRIAAINPGSTSTKIALFENERCIHNIESDYVVDLRGGPEDRRRQADELAQQVLKALAERRWGPVDAIAARGGFVPRPEGRLAGGVYAIAERADDGVAVNDALVAAMLERPEKQHASNLGIPVAARLAGALNAPAYFVDPVVVDEFRPEAEISGYRPITRRSSAHALSVRAAGRKAARLLDRPLEAIRLVVAHLGGGITVAALCNGNMVDNNIALLGEGPFTPQRAGQLPASELMDLCYSGRFTRDELVEELTRRGGLQSYLGEYRLDVIEQRIQDGDAYARSIVDAMIYQIAKAVGAMYVAADSDIEAVVLTGGMVRSAYVRDALRKRLGRLAPVLVFDEPLEMEALADGALRALTGEITAQHCRWTASDRDDKGDNRHDG